jgi:hypothetical protein
LYLALYRQCDTILATKELDMWRLAMVGVETARQQRARRWRRRHGMPDAGPAPLLEARLAARVRAEVVGYVVLAVALVGYLWWQDGTPPLSVRLAGFSAFCTALALVAVGQVWQQRRDDRRIGAALARRVAHPTALRLATVIGRWPLTAALAVYGGGAVVGIVVAVASADPGDRAAGAVVAVCVCAFAVLMLLGLTEVVRRPAVAESPQSLVDDTVLRREDAMKLIVPYPALLALVAGVNSSGDLPLVVFLAYAAIAGFLWAVASFVVTHTGATTAVALR